MSGHILLAGGAEFGGQMAIPDQRAIQLAGGPDVRITIIPTAAAPDNNHERAGNNGIRWFQKLGAPQPTAVPLIDTHSANDPQIARTLQQSQLIYLLGGFTHYLAQTLQHSPSWQAMLSAYADGALIAGSSAGAMVLCQHYFNPGQNKVESGLGLIANACVLPHHNSFGQRWAPALSQQLPHATLIGIDERTGMIDDGENGRWQVYGQGHVTLYYQRQTAVYRPNQQFELPA